jgi:hypothetical protein
MTIQQLLDGIKVNWIHVNIIEQLSPTTYIVGDATGLAIMETSQLAKYQNYIETGQGLKLIKPNKVETDVIAADHRFSPMKTKPIQLPKPDKRRLAKLQNAPKVKPAVQQVDYIDFETIKNDYQENTIVSKTLVYVATVSRLIDGKYGEYRICNIVDSASTLLTLSLYSPHIGKLEDNQVYSLTKLKKTLLKNDGSIRLNTTKFTQIQKGTPTEEALFQGVQVADHVTEGCCVMYSNFTCYDACPKHFSKLDDDGECLGCKVKIEKSDAIKDFHCFLQIEDHDDLKSILIFRRHLKTQADMKEEDLEEYMNNEFIGQNMRVQYNTPNDENNIAVKIEILADKKTE